MANKRMFSKDVVRSDKFLTMPITSQALYFHLSMEADDDGLVGNPKTLVRYIGVNDDDLRILITKGFIIPLEEGVIVIRDWKINNFIRKDRYKPTIYIKQKEQIYQIENGAYILKEEGGYPLVDQWSTIGQPSLDKSSLDKIRLDKSSLDNSYPSLDNFFAEKNIKINSFQKKDLALLLQDWTDINSAEAENIVVCALEIADEKINNRASLVNYASTVLANWKEKNLTTLQQIKKHLETKSIKPIQKPIQRTEVIPEWAKDNYRPPTIDKKDIPTKEALEEQRKQLEQQLN